MNNKFKLILTVAASNFYLDADSPATGSLLNIEPLISPYGTISFSGEIRDRGNDPEFNAAGAYGNVFDIDDGTYWAMLTFSFDIESATLIYGGNAGVFNIEARDISGGVIDSFYQPSTEVGEPAGPITLSGSGIRTLYWKDPGRKFAPIDNITITTSIVPEPISSILFVTGGTLLAGRRFIRRKA